MANVPKKPHIPNMRTQNPAPIEQDGQESASVLQTLTAQILQSFVEVLPSNYASQTNGPYYILQFQAIAEQLARLQLAIQEIGLETDVDFARPEYLWQMVGTYIFPDVSKQGIPEIDGDLTYRTFLKNMTHLLLKGSVKDAIVQGLGLLTDAQVEVLAKAEFTHEKTSGWTTRDQDTFEINILDKTEWINPNTGDKVEGDLGTGFPENVFQLLRNNQRILRALKPASKLFDYRHVFLETFSGIEDEYRSSQCGWHYEDFRQFCQGLKEITSSHGVSKQGLFYDSSLFFYQIEEGSLLEILSGPNASPENGGSDNQRFGQYRVREVLRLPFGKESTKRKYRTTPTGLEGAVLIDDDGVLIDESQDFSAIVEGEILSILEGPNAGQYRIEKLCGPHGGFPEKVTGPSDTVQVGPGILRLENNIVFDAEGQRYSLSIERLGVQKPRYVIGEDVSSQFWL